MGRDGGLETDYTALENGYVTITPVRHDLTHGEMLDNLKKQPMNLPPKNSEGSQER